ncbi:hercynylcysteine sulfoxide lyase-like [Haliotis rubra]|uniref:hercynylcysteine sulfoxide lyase-like n=1 Tax=Haliotis rubra TaxID=36100 RepID=UPI001EE53819|nr:hercynylcysteine sulfoxide lyase-like [Haliotis rubra]
MFNKHFQNKCLNNGHVTHRNTVCAHLELRQLTDIDKQSARIETCGVRFIMFSTVWKPEMVMCDVEFGKTLQEREFTFQQGTVPLNHGSYGAVARRMQEVQRCFLTEMNAQPDLWFRDSVNKHWDESVRAAARFFNCDSQDIVFVTNATEGINAVLKCYDFKEGETILSTSLTYGAVALTCRDVAAQNRVIKSEVLEIRFPIESEEAVLRQYEEICRITPRPELW